jgi:hypothetical protein
MLAGLASSSAVLGSSQKGSLTMVVLLASGFCHAVTLSTTTVLSSFCSASPQKS